MSKAKGQQTAKQARTRIVIADDHAIVRRGLCDLIAHEADLEVCAEAATPHETIEAIESRDPDVAVLDLMFAGVTGFDLLRDIKARFSVRTLILSMHDESYYAERCLRAGASGYIMKQEASDQIVRAIRIVAQGKIYLSENISGKLLHVFRDGKPAPTGVDRLTDRELQVFELLGQGMTTRQIAGALHLSVKTVETHRLNIMSKLTIANPNELIKKAVHWVKDEVDTP